MQPEGMPRRGAAFKLVACASRLDPRGATYTPVSERYPAKTRMGRGGKDQ